MEVSRRLATWVEREFADGDRQHVLSSLRELPDTVLGRQDPERIQASLVLTVAGDPAAFERRWQLLHTDWRDALVTAGLADASWESRLEEVLGPASAHRGRPGWRGGNA